MLEEELSSQSPAAPDTTSAAQNNVDDELVSNDEDEVAPLPSDELSTVGSKTATSAPHSRPSSAAVLIIPMR